MTAQTASNSGQRQGRPAWAALACVCFLAASVSAQSSAPAFRNIGLEDGLPSATVSQVLQDREGFIWVATQHGLGRYDGREFVSFVNDPEDPASLSHNHVWAVVEDDAGALWVGTDGGGLSRLDAARRSFTHWRHDPEVPGSLSGSRVRAVLRGSAGELWVGTDGRGLNRFDPATGLAVHYRHDPHDPTSLGSDLVRDLLQTADGRIWVATQGGGLSVLDPATGRFAHYRHDPADPTSLATDNLRRIRQSRDGAIWVGSYDRGLARLDPERRGFERFARDPADPLALGNDKVTALLEDSRGTVWVGTDQGLFEWLPERRGFRRHGHEGTNPRSLVNDTVTALFEDQGGVLWVGTFGGISTWNLSYRYFAHYGSGADERRQLPNPWVASFAETADGALWVGNFGGLSRLDPASGTFRHYRNDPQDARSLSDDRAMSLLVDSRGWIWVGTFGGLNRLDPATGTFERFQHDPDDPTTLSNDSVTSLVEDPEGTLWVGTYRGGLNRLDPRTGRFERFRHDPEDPSSLSSDRVMSLFRDGGGTLWIGTEDGGLNRLDRARGVFEALRHDSADPDSLSADDAWVVTGDAAGNLWVGTRSAGLNRWGLDDRRAGRVVFQRYGIEQGLPHRKIYAAVADLGGNLWVSSDGGLSRVDPATGRITNFDVSHGLQSNEFNFAAALRGRDGRLYFGGIRGFNVFDPAAVEINHHVPPVVLTSFLKFNRPVTFATATTAVEEIDLGFRDSVVAFQFAALDYTAPERNRYQYKLEGFDREWVDGNALRLSTYTNLDSGSYTFRVRAANNDGVWNEEGLAVRLAVAPPPWRSWWAYSLYALMLATVVWMVMRTLSARRRRAEELELVNASLTSEIRARKAKERALEAEKRKAREVLDVAEVMMVAIDDAGRVVLVNQKGCDVLGYPEDEIVGSDWLRKFVPEGRRDEVRGKLARIDAYQYCEYPIVTRDGEERVIAWHSTLLPWSDGEAMVVLSSGTDNTDVRKLEKQVRMQQKMDALGTLAGGIAHDFNNILTAILGYSTLTLSQLPAAGEEAGYMRHVVAGCERARDMVARILTFSRREDPKRRPIDLGPVIQEACDLLRSSLPDAVELRTAIAADLLPVTADATQIHQVLMNLGTNAGHAMTDGGGTLEIRAEMIEVAPGAQGLGGEPLRGFCVQISVIDDGHGMDKATMERIFDPFFTTKEVGSGTGLGLSVAHGIVKSHQGDISVLSAPGKGTTVTLRLPCTESAVRADAQPAPAAGGTERILLVDDEKPIVVLAQKWLEGLGYTVEPHTDSVEALAAFRAKPRRYDLLITDQSMPEMDGMGLVREVRKRRPNLPAVLTSGRRYRRESGELGCVWLQKPFTAEEMGLAVRTALDHDAARLRSVS